MNDCKHTETISLPSNTDLATIKGPINKHLRRELLALAKERIETAAQEFFDKPTGTMIHRVKEAIAAFENLNTMEITQ